MTVRSWIWDRMYRTGRTTWDLDAPDPHLLGALDTREVGGRLAIDLGCGTGDNAIELAGRGFEVVAIDVAEAALTVARRKARNAGADVDFRIGDVTRLDGIDATFDLVVDRGLLMSLFGDRARSAYVSTLERITRPGASVYEHQWRLTRPPRPLTRAGLVAAMHGVVLAHDELERRLGRMFEVQVVRESVGPVDDPGMRRVGIDVVARTSWWLTRSDGSRTVAS